MRVKICPKCRVVNDAMFRVCKKCSAPLDSVEEKDLSSEEIQKLEQALRDSVTEEERLQQRMEQIPMPTILSLIWPFLLMLFGAVFFVIACIGGGFFNIFMGLLLGAIVILCGIGFFEDNKDKYELARSDFDEYRRRIIARQDAVAREKTPEAIQQRRQEMQERKQKMLENEYQQAVASQQASEPWTVRYSTHPCPYCGHYKVRYAKWEDKQMSVAFWGMASSAIDKHYKCEWCKKMW
mgnify:FL=1